MPNSSEMEALSDELFTKKTIILSISRSAAVALIA